MLVDELHGLAIGRNIVKNLHMAGKQVMSGLPNTVSNYNEPLYDAKELRSVAPIDQKQPFDVRSIIARIVDGSEFDEFKKLYGSVRTLESPELQSDLFLVPLHVRVLTLFYSDTYNRFCKDLWANCRNYWKQWHIIY